MKQVILTGDRPTGRLHVGHYVGSLKERVKLQNSGDYDEVYIMIADAQALTDNAEHPEKVRQNIIQVALDYLACGIDPAKSTIFIQSMVPELTELTFYYMNLVTVARVQRNPTVKSEIQMRNFEASIPVGFFCYPISQAADITAFRATHVPVGEDQMPMIEQCKEIVHKFNTVYGETLTDPKIVLPSNKACLRLPGIDGKAKMSKSLGNTYTIAQLAEKGYDPLDFRFFCLNAHYRKKLNFTFEGLSAAKTSRERLNAALFKHKNGSSSLPAEKIASYEKEFEDAINDDLNIPLALAVLFNLVKEPYSADVYALALKFDKVFGLSFDKITAPKTDNGEIPAEVLDLSAQRTQAKKEKNFALADELRDKIAALGYSVKDTREGVVIVKL